MVILGTNKQTSSYIGELSMIFKRSLYYEKRLFLNECIAIFNIFVYKTTNYLKQKTVDW